MFAIAWRDDSDTIVVGESSSQDQDIAASSPVTAQGSDFHEETFIPSEIHPASEKWENHPSIPSDTSGMPTIASSTIYTTVPDTTSSWPHVPTLPDTFAFSGDDGSLGTMTGDPWMPWSSSMAHSSFPWFMNELDMPLLDMPHPHEDVAHHAVSTQQMVEASAYLSPENICSSYTQPCHPFPKPDANGLQMAGAEVFGHIHEIPRHAVDGLNNFYKTQRQESTPTVIPRDILHAFVELYFEYFDSQFPFLHPSRLEDLDLPWILLLAITAVGSHYSEIQGAEDYNTALCDLLARAVELTVHDKIMNVDVTTVQCVFLLHVLWLFSGSHRDKIVLQHRRSSLATMCWDLIGKADKQRHSDQGELDNEATWQAWIAEESGLRLVTCVRVLECLSHIYLGTPLVFNLRDATQQLPCSERLWRSRDAPEWKSQEESFTGIVTVIGIEVDYIIDDRPGNQPKPDAFVAKIVLLELYIDDRNYYRQLRTSQLLQSSYASYMNSSTNSDTQHVIHRPDTGRNENVLLDTTIDQLTLKNMSNPGDCAETIFHVIAILRLIPLETLHSATGWETNKEQMFKSKMHLNDFFRNNGVKARKCLWHATCIFKTTRSSRRLACYDALSLTVAMGYIYCYSETRASLSSTPSRPVITRLDQLQDTKAIEGWIENGGDNVVHLTGVGILDGSDRCVRFLRDLERTLVSQIAWRGFCRAFASSFAQLRRGETPTKSSREYNNEE
ncbi:hypothetical protein FMEXI_4563 [Fusarium mexicanum]|uniref:Xylanolytic transcriptional activator regulatory domain-containing protein n=1 Tax=Fusarium mexicanum TaxID=751941 RepID=A0A8H5J5Z8_9HYPO|nr:hypothetical protein FMEXI_4563 [Fusarium mexicanum]